MHPTDIRHVATEDIVCPYCGAFNTESNPREVPFLHYDCSTCCGAFGVYRTVVVRYTTHKLQPEDRK